MTTRDLETLLPEVKPSTVVPRLIHQTYPHQNLPELFNNNVQEMRRQNPGWTYNFYSDSDVEGFIKQEFGEEILSYYLRIHPSYGAARADLFRYLVIYKFGGVYLDIKSRFLRPIDDVLVADEQFVVSRWKNGKGEKHEGYGLHPEVVNYPGGELQQWHIIAASGHMFLRAVLLSVLKNIDNYSPWNTGVGRMGVLRLTGPIAYTAAITPIINQHKCRVVTSEQELFLEYSILPEQTHKVLFKSHYTQISTPIIKPSGTAIFSNTVFTIARRVKKRVEKALS